MVTGAVTAPRAGRRSSAERGAAAAPSRFTTTVRCTGGAAAGLLLAHEKVERARPKPWVHTFPGIVSHLSRQPRAGDQNRVSVSSEFTSDPGELAQAGPGSDSEPVPNR